jgi:hypothetical protein
MSDSRAISHLCLREPDWLSIKLQTRETAAASLRSILSGYEGLEDKVFYWRGRAALLIEEQELFKEVEDPEVGAPFQSFDRFLKVLYPRSWGSIRDALRTIKELKDMQPEDLVAMKRANMEQIKRISPAVRRLPEVIQAAKTKTEKDFVAYVNEVAPDQHLELKRPILLVPEGDCKEFEEAVEMVTLVEGCQSRAEALKAIGIHIIQDYAVQFESLKAETA